MGTTIYDGYHAIAADVADDLEAADITGKANLSGANFTGNVGLQKIGANQFDPNMTVAPAAGGGGVRWTWLKSTLVAGGAVANIDLAANSPSLFIPKLVQTNFDTVITGAGGCVKVGVGVVGDPDKYGLSVDLLKNSKINNWPTEAIVSAEDIQVYACDNAGGAAGTLDGTITVIIGGWEILPIADAA